MYCKDGLWIATADEPVVLNLAMANRHGLITGATGTGKTTTVKVIAESFSAAGVPVFLADIKGDVTGICKAGERSAKIESRLEGLGAQEVWEPMGFPTRFWDISGEQGHPIRVTVSDMGPALLARILSLNDVQTGVLNLVFHIADEQGLLLIDLKDLRAMLTYCAEHKAELTVNYGTISTQTIGVIQRGLITLEKQGGDVFFGEPALDINDWIMTDDDGKGFINLLNASKLIRTPLLYSTFLMWMLSELYENLPEEGDMDKPKMVFFFDEAHLLFADAPKAFLDKVTQIVKLIRSKGIGIYFISQSPSDIPDSVLSQLQNRVQHALRAYTPLEQKAVRVAAQSFRPNPAFSTVDAISTMGVGEALVSFLDRKGIPGMVEKTRILPPQSLMAPADPAEVDQIIAESELEDLYREPFDRESAYEILNAEKMQEEQAAAEEQARLEQEQAEYEARQLDAEEKRRQDREAAKLERERRRAENAAIREQAAARLTSGTTRPYGSSHTAGYQSTSRVYSGSRTTTGASRTGYTGRNSNRSYNNQYNSYDYGYAEAVGADYNNPAFRVPQTAGIGRPTGQSINRGYLGNRRW